MKPYYLLPIFGALLVASALTSWWCPPALYSKVATIVTVTLLFAVVGSYLIYQRYLQIIYQQIQQTIQTLEDFDLDAPVNVTFQPSPFPIFKDLNQYLAELIDRIRSDHQANKQFTQHASHELQTPLAIIKGNVEILLLSPHLQQKEFESLAIVLQNTNRLAKLNGALILLSKIEHQHFSNTETVNFAELTDEILENFRDLIHLREITIHKDYQQPWIMEMSPALAEILIANLLQNAIRHNNQGGSINICIHSTWLEFNNTGKILTIDPQQLFQRFQRISDTEESLGLGLSIIQRICERYQLDVAYTHQTGLHRLVVQQAYQ
ncbi:MAG: sensor histidine kinase [Saprospiraceae bacterium]